MPIGPAETLAYLGLVVGVGLAGAAQLRSGGESYFLAGRELSAWTACFSLLATEVTVIAFAAVATSSAIQGQAGIHLALGYLIGRVLLAVTLLPGLFNGTQSTAYQRLHMRFGLPMRWLGTALFGGVRVLRDTLVLFASTSLLVLVSGWSLATALATVAAVALFTVALGGLRSVVWMDVAHLAVVAVAALLLVGTAAEAAGGLWPALSGAASDGASWSFDLRRADTFIAGLVGGAAWSAASYSVDHLTVQRLLATGSVVRARLALIGTGVLIVPVVHGASLLGTGLLETGSDAGLSGWIAAALFASAASALSASAIALGSSTAHDVVAPTIDGDDEGVSLSTARLLSAAWLVAIVAGAVMLRPGSALAMIALEATAVVYGVLLGLFVVAGLRRTDPMRGSPGSFLLRRLDAWVAVGVGIAVTTWLTRTGLAWPWFVPLGATTTVIVGLVARTIHKAVHDPTI